MEVPSDLLTVSVTEPVLEPNTDGLGWPVALSDWPLSPDDTVKVLPRLVTAPELSPRSVG